MKKIAHCNLSPEFKTFSNLAGAGVLRRIQVIEKYLQSCFVTIQMYILEQDGELETLIGKVKNDYFVPTKLGGETYKRTTFLVTLDLSDDYTNHIAV